MERKKAILIAVFINAGLLAVLFVAALTMQEETVSPREMASSTPPLKPLYQEFSEPTPLIPVAKQEEFPSLPHLQLPLPSPVVKSEEPIVHHLPKVVPEPVVAIPSVPVVSPSVAEIVVKKGDSLEKIAKGCSVTVDELISLNRLTTHLLKVGQVLKVPTEKRVVANVAPKQIAVEKSASAPDYYTVKVGDNPWTIAMKHHMKVEELLRINGLNEEKARKLKPGDRLRIR